MKFEFDVSVVLRKTFVVDAGSAWMCDPEVGVHQVGCPHLRWTAEQQASVEPLVHTLRPPATVAQSAAAKKLLDEVVAAWLDKKRARDPKITGVSWSVVYGRIVE